MNSMHIRTQSNDGQLYLQPLKNSILMKQNLFILSLILISFQGFSQEYLAPLSINPAIKQLQKQSFFAKQTQSTDTLELPFIDDFSASKVYPDEYRWADRFAYINQSYGVNAPTIGVATLDALDFDGSLYEDAATTPFPADRLTSLPLNLDGLNLSDSVYFSFFYQPQGRGDNPESNDSLYLEIYSTESNEWYWLWGVKGSALTDFEQVILQIPDTASDGSLFYTKGFKFRFSNLASLGNLTEQSFASNCDHWNLDYIYLNKNRSATDTILLDLSFLSNPAYLLKDYSSMPYQHYNINASQLTSTYSLHFTNIRDVSMIVSFSLDVFNVTDGGNPIHIIPGGSASANFLPGDTVYSNTLTSNPFLGSSDPSKAQFKIRGIVKPGEAVSDFSAENDTAWYFMDFDNYYAYDDGSAESGYGLSGDGTQNAMAAYRFRNYLVNDSLRAIKMYFNQALGGANQDYFYLMIWDHDSETNRPGEVIYSQIGLLPQYSDSLHQFLTYRFQTADGLDTAIQVPDTFYIGWKQTTTDLLNIGFDKNRNTNINQEENWSNPYLYYNISGGWQASSFEGALMMRPVFQYQGPLADVSTPDFSEMEIYPNPADAYLHIQLKEDLSSKSLLRLYDIQGRLCLEDEMVGNHITMDVSSIQAGIYILKLTSGSADITRKVIIK